MALAPLLVAAAVACDPTPHASVYLLGDSNLPVAELNLALQAREQPYLATMDGDPELGVLETRRGAGFARARLAAVINRIHPDVVVIELGVNDRELTTDYGPAIDSMLEVVPASTKVIWVGPPETPATLPGAAVINASLAAAQDRHDNLWAVSFHRVLHDGLGDHCADLSGLRPLADCFIDYDHDVHLSKTGRDLWAIVVRGLIDLAIDQGFARPDVIPMLIDAMNATTTTTSTTTGPPTTAPGASVPPDTTSSTGAVGSLGG